MSAGQRRIAVGIEYDGSRHAGWQAQPGLPTLQRDVEAALAAVADHGVEVTCAGRTDAGVHAILQVAHFDTIAVRTARSWVLGANTRLPPEICLHWAAEVDPGFHARYGALARTYLYRIANVPTRPVLLRDRVCWSRESLDGDAMHVAAQALVGEHDFSAFRAAECQAASAVRHVESVRVAREGEFICIEVSANAFLHHMVRNIAGTLLEVGSGERPAEWVAGVLAGRDRAAAGMTAPASGLYLLGVRYAGEAGLPAVTVAAASAIIPVAWRGGV